MNIYIYIYIYDHGQPCTYVISGREITKYMVIYGEYIHMIMVNLVYTLFLAGKSPNIWSYTVNIYIYICI